MIHFNPQTKTFAFAFSLLPELLLGIAALSDLDQEIRIFAGLVGIILGVATIYKIVLETKIKKLELREREAALRRAEEERQQNKDAA